MICLADHKVERLATHEADIRRPRLTVPSGDFGDILYKYFFHNSDKIMEGFIALKEFHLAIREYFLIWGSTVSGPGYGVS